MVHCGNTVHLAMFSVNPHEIHPGGAGDFRHRTIGECYATAARDFSAPGFFEKSFQIVNIHKPTPRNIFCALL
jgi:hypothetical protein